MLGSDDGCFPVERSWLYLDLRMMACQAMHGRSNGNVFQEQHGTSFTMRILFFFF